MEYSKTIGMPVCTTECMHAVEMNAVVRHLRNTHKMDAQEAQRIYQGLKVLEQSCGESGSALRSLYLSASKGEEGLEQKLPAIPELPVRDCIKCSACSYMALNMNTFRKHYGEKCPRGEDDNYVKCKGQSLFGGNQKRYLEVYMETEGDCGILKRVLEVEGNKPSRAQEADVSRMDPYLSQMRFDVHLNRMGMSLEEAWKISKFEEGEGPKKLRRTLEKYMRRAFETCQKNVHIQAHRFMEDPLQLALEEETLKRYMCRVGRLLSLLLKSSTAKLAHVTNAVPSDIKRMVEEVSRSQGTGDMKAMHKILWHCFFDIIKEGQESVPVFISCSSVMKAQKGDAKSKFRFGTASETSGMLAALKYVARCVVVTEVYIETEAMERVTRAWPAVEVACNSHADTGISFISYCLKKSNLIRSGETSNPRFHKCGKHVGCGIVDGAELSLKDLGEKMKTLQGKSWDLLDKSILRGFVISQGFWSRCSDLQDNLTDRTPGYWFGMHPANYAFVREWRNLFVIHMKDLLFDEDERAQSKECTAFLNACEELQTLLVALLQVCSGSPARATEACILQVCNTDLAGRHLFISRGQVLFTSSYHKGRNMDGGVGKPVARFPDAVTSGLLLVYLIVVRPLETVVVKAICGNEDPGTKQVTEHRDYLFASRGRYMDARSLRERFQDAMNLVGISFGVNQYRHFQTGAVKHLLGIEQTDGVASDALNALHRQSGHSVNTAHRIYGVGELDMRSMSSIEMESFRHSSMLWLRAIGMKFGEANAPCQTTVTTETPNEIAAPKCNCSCSKMLAARLHSMETLLKTLAAGLLKEGDRAVKRKLSMDEELPAKRTKISVKDALRQVVGQGDADFKNVEQEEAVILAVEGKRDALVILPTGCGKSMTFLLAAFMNPRKLCIVVAPLVALQKDLEGRCRTLGIQVSMWKDRNVAGTRILLISAEHVLTSQYETFVREQSALGRLHCLFVDEAHLFLTWQDFRVALSAVGTKVRPDGVSCGIVALTATAPCELRDGIANACGLRDEYKLIRAATSRGNIAYRVRDALNESLVFVVLQEIRNFAQGCTGERSRSIVYCQTKVMCTQLYNIILACCPELPCFMYHADLSEELRQRNQSSWESLAGGKPKLMISTSAFGCGIDMPTVRLVVHAGRPRRLIDYIQESGRAGRDGMQAESMVVLSSLENAPVEGEEERFGSTSFMLEKKTCFRWPIDSFADGNATKASCQERNMELCDFCKMSNRRGGSGSTDTGNPVSTAETGIHMFSSGKETDAPSNKGSASVGTPNTKKSGFAIARCEAPSPTYASASELKELCRRVGNLCPICTFKARKEVHHNTNNIGCYRGRCLRCGLQGHDYKECQRLTEVTDACYGCFIRTYRNEIVHGPGTYGSRKCPLKKLLIMCFLAWEDAGMQARMREEVPELRTMRDGQFGNWLTERQDDDKAGVGVIGLWVYEKVCQTV